MTAPTNPPTSVTTAPVSTVAASPTIAARAADVVMIGATVCPEGAGPPVAYRGLPGVAAIFAALPDPLPAAPTTAACPPPDSSASPASPLLGLTLADGRTLAYGPESLPDGLDAVRDALFDLADRRASLAAVTVTTWPGGTTRRIPTGDPRLARWDAGLPAIVGPVDPNHACRAGTLVTLAGTDGGSITYGPCSLPGDIARLATALGAPNGDGAAHLRVTITASVVRDTGPPPFTLTIDTPVGAVVGQLVPVRVTATAPGPRLVVMDPNVLTKPLRAGQDLPRLIGPVCATRTPPSDGSSRCSADEAQIRIGAPAAPGPVNPGPIVPPVFTMILDARSLSVGHFEVQDQVEVRQADVNDNHPVPVDLTIWFDVQPDFGSP
jgi:hypothetical protein